MHNWFPVDLLAAFPFDIVTYFGGSDAQFQVVLRTSQ